MTCNHEAPSVEAASQEWSDQVAFVGVAWQGSEQRMQEFVDRHGLTFPNLNDDASVVFDHFDVPYQPAWVFVSPDGSTHRVLGSLEEDGLDQLLTNVTEGV